MRRQVALRNPQNRRPKKNAREKLVQGYVFDTTDSGRLCFLDYASASLKRSKRRRRIFLSWHPTKRQVEETSAPPPMLWEAENLKGRVAVGGSLRQQWRQWRDVGYRLRCGFYRLVLYAIPFHHGCFQLSVRIDRTQSTIYSRKPLEEERKGTRR